MSTREVSDYYEAVYYVSQGCVIEKVIIIEMDIRYAWNMEISGNELNDLAEMYRMRKAVSNVYAFLTAKDTVREALETARKSGEAVWTPVNTGSAGGKA